MKPNTLALIVAAFLLAVAPARGSESIWIEAEHLDGVRGYCCSRCERRETSGHLYHLGSGCRNGDLPRPAQLPVLIFKSPRTICGPPAAMPGVFLVMQFHRKNDRSNTRCLSLSSRGWACPGHLDC